MHPDHMDSVQGRGIVVVVRHCCGPTNKKAAKQFPDSLFGQSIYTMSLLEAPPFPPLFFIRQTTSMNA